MDDPLLVTENDISLKILPREMILSILYFANPKDVIAFGQTCKEYLSLSNENGVWQTQSSKRWWSEFASRGSSPLFPELNWKTYYILKTAFLETGSLQWSKITANTFLRKRSFHSGTTVGNKVFYIAGQHTATLRYNDVFYYDTETNFFENVSIKGNVPYFGKHAAAEVNGLIYVFGGFDGTSKYHDLSIFDTKTNEWIPKEAKGDVPLARTNHCMVAIGKKLYLFGGLYKTLALKDLRFLADLYVLDTTTMTWTYQSLSGDPLPPRSGFTMKAIDNKILVFGGEQEEWEGKTKCFDVWIIDIEKFHVKRCKTTGTIQTSLNTASVVIGPFVLIFGGQYHYSGSLSDGIFHTTGATYLLDTITMNWFGLYPKGNGASERSCCVANLVNDKIVFSHGYYKESLSDIFTMKMSKKLHESLTRWESSHGSNRQIP